MEPLIDIRQIIMSRNSQWLRWVPGVVVKGIEKIIHQDKLNDFMIRHRGTDSFAFCEAVLKELNVCIKVEGKAHIPRYPNPCIIVANHPLGGLDAVALVHALQDTRPDVKFVVNDLLMGIRNLQDRFVGVNKLGKTATSALHNVEAQFATGTATCVFPAGLVSRKKQGKVADLDWKKTFVTRAVRFHRQVLPIHISGALTNRFYRTASIRQWLGIPWNMEMLLLVDEFYRQRDTTIQMVIGRPVDAGRFTTDRTHAEWAQWMRREVYALKKAN